jgi:hypothetical protein
VGAHTQMTWLCIHKLCAHDALWTLIYAISHGDDGSCYGLGVCAVADGITRAGV